jgi:hypothetical protein
MLISQRQVLLGFGEFWGAQLTDIRGLLIKHVTFQTYHPAMIATIRTRRAFMRL